MTKQSVLSIVPAITGEGVSADLARDVIEALPAETYRALAWPARTVEACAKIVADAMRTSNPRRVRAWIDYERSVPRNDDLIECLDGVLHRMLRPGAGLADRVLLGNSIRTNALDHLKSTRTKAAVRESVDPIANAFVDGALATMRLHDPQLAEHAEVTAEYAERLATYIELDADAIARARIAASLHDLGKLALPHAILSKPLPLTVAETEDVRRYPARSAAALRAVPELAAVATIVELHRERADGKGYYGRLDFEIPLESQIVSIVDAFHTMTLPRPYRRARTVNAALTELVTCAGTQFDATLVDAFRQVVGEREQAKSA